MAFKCKIGLHSWNGCICSDCGKTRDEQHDWSKDCEKCSKCGKTRYNQHDYSKDCEQCSRCGKSRDNQHNWGKDCEKCSICGKTRENKHDWSIDYEKCSKCGKLNKIEWAVIPAGNFIMGSPETEVNSKENETQHEVTLSAFKISKHQITIGQFKSFVDATGYVTDAEKGIAQVWSGTKLEQNSGINWKCDEQGKQRPLNEYNHPVTYLTWEDANAFAKWMGCRLPTEAEWEYACRAGTKSPFNTGNSLTISQANYKGIIPNNNIAMPQYRNKTMSVGSFPANAWGLYDMHGNVDEWCSDYYGEYLSYHQTNPTGNSYSNLRVYRGGAYNSTAGDCRSARHNASPPDYAGPSFGFRIASTE